jgi:(1->4)-alpha-D-glucan 1-alpha-D-glucosylmutase
MSDPASSSPASEILPDAETLRQRVRQHQHLPASTYRLQLHKDFSFRHATAVVPYLAQLGVGACYSSPYLQARPGSMHGYDMVDHTRLNSELGSEADYQAFTDALRSRHMGQVLDFVPNHMGVDPVANRWWRDVLENGLASPYAHYFDIDWDPVKPELKGKVLLPVLGGPYGEVLERGELRLAFADGAFVLHYYEQNWPIDPRQYPTVLRHGLERLQAELPPEDAHLQEFLSILTQLEHLPPTTESERARCAERQREKSVARERLTRLVKEAPRIQQHIETVVQAYNGLPGKPDSFDSLHELLEAQPYRLAYWKTAVHEINYRRFFDINDLGGVRMEEPAVFAATHPLVLRLIREGRVTGLRLDHLDGLFDPVGYLEHLQTAVLRQWAVEGSEVSPAFRDTLRSWWLAERHKDPAGPAARPLYLVIEKILSGNETLPTDWPTHGTSGYDFMNDLNRLFVDPSNMKSMRRVYARFTERETPFAEIVYECKRLICRTSMASELNVLANVLNRISEGDRRLRDFTLSSLRAALFEVVACFPVYRTYVTAAGASDGDRQMIDVALGRAARRNPAMEPSVFDFLRHVLSPQPTPDTSEAEYQRRLDFAMKFQQYTGPVQAKGVEDTAFYRYNVLLSLNEVGGDPQRFGAPVSQFHEGNRRRRQHWPYAMLATATHDTKRGEDARARLNVLSEIPKEWGRQVSRWARINARHRTLVDGVPAPDRNDEYFFYQALLGAWPAEPAGSVHETAPPDLVQRLGEYIKKALKEAKVHTSWINPHEAYDRAVADFVKKSLTGRRAARFLAEFLPFQQRIARLGMVNSLAQVLLKIVSPGVPDFYQGTELWDLSLVDPDNRRPVDYNLRRQMLESLGPLLERPEPQALQDLLEHWDDGRIKLFITTAGLRCRSKLARVFLDGEYLPLEVEGEAADHVVALARRYQKDWVLAVVPRLNSALLTPTQFLPIGPAVWRNTWLKLPPDLGAVSYRSVFTGATVQPQGQQGNFGIAVAEALHHCPVALLQAVSVKE